MRRSFIKILLRNFFSCERGRWVGRFQCDQIWRNFATSAAFLMLNLVFYKILNPILLKNLCCLANIRCCK